MFTTKAILNQPKMLEDQFCRVVSCYMHRPRHHSGSSANQGESKSTTSMQSGGKPIKQAEIPALV